MKKLILLAMVIGLLVSGCTWNKSKIENKMGPPHKTEMVDGNTRYFYYYRWFNAYWCKDFLFDKEGNLITKREYEVVMPQQELKSPDKSSMRMGTSWPITLGYVVTNHHVVEGHKKITLICPDGKKIPATIFVDDKINDIVLLKVANTKELPPALPIAVAKPGIGAKVFTIGYPHTDILGAKPKLTDGLISSVSGFQDDPRTYQITVPLQAGNSGGPLLNLNGEVVGIVTSKVDAIKMFKWTGDLPQNVNYAVKISYLKVLIDSVTPMNYSINELTNEPGDLETLAKRIQDSMMIVLAE